MTWTKTGDDFPETLFDLSSDAYRLHHAALTFCNRLGLDGVVPKVKFALIAVPTRVRRRAVVEELIGAQHWADVGDAYVLLDFMANQPSREVVEARRRWDAVRQRIRYAKSDQDKAALRPDETAAREDYNAARERQRALLSQREKQRETQLDSQRDSQRPVQSRPDPSRPADTRDEDEGRGRDRAARHGLVGATANTAVAPTADAPPEVWGEDEKCQIGRHRPDCSDRVTVPRRVRPLDGTNERTDRAIAKIKQECRTNDGVSDDWGHQFTSLADAEEFIRTELRDGYAAWDHPDPRCDEHPDRRAWEVPGDDRAGSFECHDCCLMAWERRNGTPPTPSGSSGTPSAPARSAGASGNEIDWEKDL